MKYLRLSESHWKRQAEKSIARKTKEKNRLETIRKHFPLYDEFIGKVVEFNGEYGIVIIKDNVLCIRWDTNKKDDCERLDGGNWIPTICKDQNYEFKYINKDGNLK